ncbi:hypothetical protein BDW71DRAFT_215150 [Aspergillus fruticulosus]
MASTAKRTEDCLAELEAQFNRETKTLSDVLLILGRTGAGKSSLLEDLSGLAGYSQQNADSVTKTTELCKASINAKPYFIMDTPGFDPTAEEKTFIEIVRGLESIRPFARITGFLYLTCIPQARFDEFDRKLIKFIRALGGADYIPRVTFITTFWTATPGQAASYSQQLVFLQRTWEEGVGVQNLKMYQHGREYNAAGEDTGSVIDWFTNREQIARHAKEMVARNYGGPSIVTSKIERELRANVPIHETYAGRLFGLPASSQHKDSGSAQGDSPAPGASGREDASNANGKQTASQSEANPTLCQRILDGICQILSNVEFKVGVDIGGGGGEGGMAPNPVRGDPFRGGGDPNSHVDFMKASGRDWSKEGRKRYAQQNNIEGEPFTAEWGDAMLRHLKKHG